ncbi:MAG: GNAT family N-acetyltransferase, partial [Synergistaceae bacterium]|nr:GNAT family N-acetyltransferase [Synergistaceae bacterium]
LDGFVTDEADLTDEMFANASLHNESGKWQMLFGLNTLPAYRNRGCAGELVKRAIQDAHEQGRLGLVLTCKESLLHYYAKFGFISEGVSQSKHGGAKWYQMRLQF